MKEILLIIVLTLGVQADLIENLKKKCNNQNGESCNSVAILYYTGQDTKQSYAEAKAYYDKACDLNYAEGCTGLGNLFHLGQGIEQDYPKAKVYFTKACMLGSSDGCSNLGDLYYSDDWMEYNVTNAELYYKKSCKIGSKRGCNNLKKLLDDNRRIEEYRDKLKLLKEEQEKLKKKAILIDKL